MNSSRCSKLAAALVVVLLAATVPAAAVTVEGEAPDSAEVGEQLEPTTFTIQEPFSEYEEWTLRANTDLTDVTWQVTTFDNAGNQVAEETLTGQSMQYQLQASSGVTRVEVRLVGTTPDDSAFDWSYDPAQQVTYAEFLQTQEGGSSDVLETYQTRPYTADSQEARDAIAAAQQAISDASGSADVSDAEGDLQDAVEFYNSGNFEQAISNANEAEEAASSAASSAQQMDLLLMVGAGVVVVAVLAGGVYWYLQQRDSYDKLG